MLSHLYFGSFGPYKGKKNYSLLPLSFGPVRVCDCCLASSMLLGPTMENQILATDSRSCCTLLSHVSLFIIFGVNEEHMKK